MSGTPWGLPRSDLEEIVERLASDLDRWSEASILVTGGSGFIGSWLVASLIWANRRLKLGLRLQILSRRPSLIPLDESSSLRLVQGDVLDLPPLVAPDVIVHGAAVSNAPLGDGSNRPLKMAATIVDGTRGLLELAAASKARFLYISSGAVYGRQIVPSASEDDSTAPDPLDPNSAYGGAKRLAETWCAASTKDGQVEAVIARPFSFVGPRLPLDQHFAAGNFLADLMAGRPIQVTGDGRAIRSYLYAGELAEWLLVILSRGTAGRAYNVGSSEAVTIVDVAHRISRLSDPALQVEVNGSAADGAAHRYVPDVTLAAKELGLQQRIALDEALIRWRNWLALRGAGV